MTELPRPARVAFCRRSWRKGSVALLAALLALPLIGLVGLAIDFSLWNQAKAALTLAANAATLNAVKVAAAGDVAGNPNYLRDGQQAGLNWFAAQSGKTGLTTTGVAASVTITAGSTVTATLTGTAQVPAIFGVLFGVTNYKVAVTTQAVKPLSLYVEVVMMLDDSSSMGIGATGPDILTMLLDGPCDPSMRFTTTNGVNYSDVDNRTYGEYACSAGSAIYDGANPPWNGPACPVRSGATTYTVASSSTIVCPGKVNNYKIYGGPPCAFACHWDSSKPAGLGNDLWAMARKNGATLRFDLLKNAVQQVITTMQAKSQPANTLSLGIYTFDSSVNRVYPTGAEAGTGWAQAAAAVGVPPTPGSGVYTETGMQPVMGNVSANTNFTQDMTALSKTYVTAAGDGTGPSKPRKVLFLVTDGMDDELFGSSRSMGPMPSSSCQLFKNMGYTVYVLYTPYYPLMNPFYLQNVMQTVEGSGSTSLSANLKACSSSTGAADLSTYYIEASDQTTLNAALQTFLQSSLGNPARYTQ